MRQHKVITSILLGAGVSLLVAFGVLSKYEDRSFMRNLDYAVTVKLQDRIDKSSHLRFATAVGNIMEGATFFASPEFTVVVTLGITVLLCYDRKKKKWHVEAGIVPLALLAIVLIEIFGKSIVHHPSPPFSMVKHPTTLFPADYVNEQFSYPSGHAARAIFMALLTVLVLLRSTPKKASVFVIICAVGGYVATVATSRIYLGHHWFSDVMGGLLLGAGCGLLSMVLINRHV